MDGLQRVVLFTSSNDLKKRVVKGSEKELPHTALSVSLIGTGLSLVDDTRGGEVAYIGIPQYVDPLVNCNQDTDSVIKIVGDLYDNEFTPQGCLNRI